MPGRKTYHPANARLWLAGEQRGSFLTHVRQRRCGRKQCREIVVENKSAGIARIAYTLRAGVSGAQITSGIVFWEVFRRFLFDLPKPRAFGSLGRNQHPFTQQGIKPSVRKFVHMFFRLIQQVEVGPQYIVDYQSASKKTALRAAFTLVPLRRIQLRALGEER